MNISVRRYLEILVNNGALTKLQAEKYEIDSLKQNDPIDIYLLNNTNLKKEDILKAKGDYFNIEAVDISHVPITPQAVSLIPEPIARNYHLVPYELNEKTNTLKLIMADPFDINAIDFLTKKTGKKIVPLMGLPKDIEECINVVYTQSLSPNITEALKDVEPSVKTLRADQISNIIKEAPIAKIVTTILEFAIKGRASDVHIEPLENKTRVRYRIDGLLQEKLILPKGIHDSLVSRIKILSGLKIDEKRIPQDGRFNFKMGDEEVDLRVSTLPTAHGEKVVMRLLKKTGGIPLLSELGLRGPQLKALEESILKPYGIVLVTGPTGSGKSTTLYSVLSTLNKQTVNIVTLEDPIEYQLMGINQVQINPQAGLTFATGLRAFLRQDPNIILVGEIRDKETTTLAIQAALTGHLVFSTLHTNDAATSIPRLIDLGAETFLIASVLNAIVAQRIVRRLCDHCKIKHQPDPEVTKDIINTLGNFAPLQCKKNPDEIRIYKSNGCSECNNMGYYGRIGIFEVIKVTSSIIHLIIQHSDAKQIEAKAVEEGLISMKQDGYLKVIEGVTSIEEVLRVAEI